MRRGRRRGSTYLELQVALAVLGVALAGLAPVVVGGLRLTARLERRFPAGATYLVIPPSDTWARKIGASATVAADEPAATLPPAAAEPVNTVEIVSLERSSADDRVTASVTVTPIEPDSGGTTP